MLLGRELRRARRDADLTQEQLAATAKVDRTYISDIENDKVSPTVDMLERLCAALGVRASVILARAEDALTPADEESASE
jgi:transcriptional regulator with XRE-family HTH domain